MSKVTFAAEYFACLHLTDTLSAAYEDMTGRRAAYSPEGPFVQFLEIVVPLAGFPLQGRGCRKLMEPARKAKEEWRMRVLEMVKADRLLRESEKLRKELAPKRKK